MFGFGGLGKMLIFLGVFIIVIGMVVLVVALALYFPLFNLSVAVH